MGRGRHDVGQASIEVAALPVSKVSGPKEDDMTGVSAQGLLVNISPTTARSTFKLRQSSVAGDNAVETVLAAHPVELSGSQNELRAPGSEEALSRRVRKGLSVRPLACLDCHIVCH